MSTGKWVLPLLLAAAMAPSAAAQGYPGKPIRIATRARIFKAAGTKAE
jgi:hypothetical protein